MGKRKSLAKNFRACHNSYGFRAIWSQIFFQSKIYLNRSSAQKSHQKSLKSCLRTLYDVMNDMAEEFFFVKTHMGTPLHSIFLTHKRNIQLQVRAHLAAQIKNCFGTIKELPIWFFGNEGILVSQNSYGHTMVWSSVWSDFFAFARVDQKLI